MSRPKPTIKDMEDVLALAKARGLGGKFWDDQRRYLVITLPEDGEKTTQAETCGRSAERDRQQGDGGDGEEGREQKGEVEGADQ